MATRPGRVMTPPMQTMAVRLFAEFYDLGSVQSKIFEEFGIEVDKSTLHRYNPDCRQGAESLSAHLKELFATERQAFLTDRSRIPIANRNWRLRELMTMYKEAPVNNRPLRASLLEQASKESGDFWTNRREVSGPGGKPVEIVTAELTPAERAARVAALLSNAGAVEDGAADL